MRIYKIAVNGDNDRLHEEWLAKAVEAIEAEPTSHVYRAWVERVDHGQIDREAPLSKTVR